VDQNRVNIRHVVDFDELPAFFGYRNPLKNSFNPQPSPAQVVFVTVYRCRPLLCKGDGRLFTGAVRLKAKRIRFKRGADVVSPMQRDLVAQFLQSPDDEVVGILAIEKFIRLMTGNLFGIVVQFGLAPFRHRAGEGGDGRSWNGDDGGQQRNAEGSFHRDNLGWVWDLG
jgi:hypothetical protein